MTAGQLLIRHELRLAWRDWVALLAAGRRQRVRWAAGVLVVAALVMHLLAYGIIAGGRVDPSDPGFPAVLTAGLVLSWFLMLSQGMESVTRAFYARGDLDLLLSSPVPPRIVFAVRMVGIALSVGAAAMLLFAPFVNVLAALDGPRWLMAYGVGLALGLLATAAALVLTAGLFRTLGPKRARFLSQVSSAVIGAAFVIGIQVAAILSYGTLARVRALQSPTWRTWLPGEDHPALWPARGAMGEPWPLVATLAFSGLALGATVLVLGDSFGRFATAASGVDRAPSKSRKPARFAGLSPQAVLRRKEWLLLKRDPWLASQSLMQLLYLIPPALLLWYSFGYSNSLGVLVPVLVMAAGQLAGGLAWLAVSGEDAPDLIASAPISPLEVQLAKFEAVMGSMALVFAPLLLVLALTSVHLAFVTAIGIVASGGSATLIQIWFRAQARRSHFRRRQTSSRLATFAEAFSSIGWAGTFALVAVAPMMATAAALLPLAVLAAARLLRPAAPARSG